MKIPNFEEVSSIVLLIVTVIVLAKVIHSINIQDKVEKLDNNLAVTVKEIETQDDEKGIVSFVYHAPEGNYRIFSLNKSMCAIRINENE